MSDGADVTEQGPGTGEAGAVATLETDAGLPEPPVPPPPDPFVALRRDRVWLPLLIPIGAIVAVLFVVLNISRIFLAVSHSDKAIAVMIGTGLTVLILAGAALLSASPRVRTCTSGRSHPLTERLPETLRTMRVGVGPI